MKRINLPTPVIFFVSLGAMIGLFVFKYNLLPPEVPLFYSRPRGDQQIADLFALSVIPVLALLFISINAIVVRRFFNDSELIQHLAYYTNIIIIVISMVIFTKIIFLVS